MPTRPRVRNRGRVASGPWTGRAASFTLPGLRAHAAGWRWGTLLRRGPAPLAARSCRGASARVRRTVSLDVVGVRNRMIAALFREPLVEGMRDHVVLKC